MIDYIKMRYAPNTTEVRFFRALEAATDVVDFLKRIQLTDDQIKEFMNQNGDPATRDFSEYKKRYFGTDEEG